MSSEFGKVQTLIIRSVIDPGGAQQTSRAPARALLSHLDGRDEPAASSLVRVRRIRRRDRPPVLLPQQVQAILDGCAVYDAERGEWVGNLRDRLLFALLAETGMRLGEALGMRINDFVVGRGGTPYVEIVPRDDNPNEARVKMMRARRVYVGTDLEQLFADYLTHLACRAAEPGMAITVEDALLVNLDRPPFLAAMSEGSYTQTSWSATATTSGLALQAPLRMHRQQVCCREAMQDQGPLAS